MKRRMGSLSGLGPAIVLTAALVLGSSMASRTTAFAEDRQGASGWQVTFDGKKMSSNFTTANMGDEINQMQPGDSVELTISLKNTCKEEADWYMKNEVLSTLEDAGNAAGGAYDYLLTYTDTKGTLTTLYSSEKFGGDGRINGVGLHGATTTLENYFYLDRMGKGDTGVVKLKVALDGETLVNNYQNTYAKLQMDFATELVGGVSAPPGNTPGRNREVIKTGDQTQVMLYVLLMLGAGLILMLLAVMRMRRDRDEEFEKETGSMMKRTRKIRAGLMILVILAVTAGRPVSAKDVQYTYTVRLYAGNQGTLTGEGISAPEGAHVAMSGDHMLISGLKYGDTVYMDPNEAAKAVDQRYHVKGVRRSGRDNSEATEAAFQVGSDRDYVIAYAVSGDMVKYTVNYQDAAGNNLLPSNTYYGNKGERQYVSAKYVDGYLPQAYNLVMTLSENETENVFNFRYTPVETAAGPAGEEETPGTDTTGTGTGTAEGTAPGADAGTAGAGADAGAGAGADEGAGAEAGVGGDAPVAVPDDAVPQADAPEQVIDMDEDVPLAKMDPGRPGGLLMGYMPIYIGIGAAAVLALAGMAFYLRKRRQAVVRKHPRELAEELIRRQSDDEM